MSAVPTRQGEQNNRGNVACDASTATMWCRACLAPAVAVVMLAVPGEGFAHSNVFHVKTLDVKRGEISVEALTGIHDGHADEGHEGHGHDDEEHEHEDDHEGEHAHEDERHGDEEHVHEEVRAANELSLGYGVTSFWKAEAVLSFEKPLDGDYNLNSAGVENTFVIIPHAGARGFGLGWYTGLLGAIDDEATNSVEFGPVFSLRGGGTQLVLNPFLEKTFGQNREEGIAFTYGWQLMTALSDEAAIGIEGAGAIENLGNAPAFDEQIHRIGPVLRLGHGHGTGDGHREHDDHGAHHLHARKHGDDPLGGLHFEIGALFGLTDATPDVALKANVGMHF